jgi:hypothetical protein
MTNKGYIGGNIRLFFRPAVNRKTITRAFFAQHRLWHQISPARFTYVNEQFQWARERPRPQRPATVIEPNQSDIGVKVIFRVHGSAKVEEGVITRLNKKYVFVRFGKEEKSAVMPQDELEWKDARSRSSHPTTFLPDEESRVRVPAPTASHLLARSGDRAPVCSRKGAANAPHSSPIKPLQGRRGGAPQMDARGHCQWP